MILSQIKGRGGKRAKKRKNESAKADPEEVVHTYVIDCLNIGIAKHDLGDSK